MAAVQDNYLPMDSVANEEQDHQSNAVILPTDDSTDHSHPAVNVSDASLVSAKTRPASEGLLRPSTRDTVFLDARHLSLPTPHSSKSEPATTAAPVVQNAPKPKKTPSFVGTLRSLKKKLTNGQETKSAENYYVARWRCAADADNELSFEKGDRLRIIDAQHEARGWLLAELNGKRGLVPINYLRSGS